MGYKYFANMVFICIREQFSAAQGEVEADRVSFVELAQKRWFEFRLNLSGTFHPVTGN